MPIFDIDIEVYCETCGEGLCGQSYFTVTKNRRNPCVRVDACKTCIDNALDILRKVLEND
jgi:hypothetical protein